MALLPEQVKQIADFYDSVSRFVGVEQGCINPGSKLARATRFCTASPNICGTSVRNLFDATRLAPRILIKIVVFWKMCGPLMYIRIKRRRHTALCGKYCNDIGYCIESLFKCCNGRQVLNSADFGNRMTLDKATSVAQNCWYLSPV